jgi:hypothetical protein
LWYIFKIRTTVQINRNRSQKTFQVLTLENKTKGTPRGGLQMRSSLHAGERTVRHAHAELMREQQTTTHTLTNTLNTLSLTVRAQMLRIRGLKVLENTQMFCIIEFHFIDLSLRIFNTNLYYCSPKACNGFGNGV